MYILIFYYRFKLYNTISLIYFIFVGLISIEDTGYTITFAISKSISEWQVPNFGVQNQNLLSLQLTSQNDTCSTSDDKIKINIYLLVGA